MALDDVPPMAATESDPLEVGDKAYGGDVLTWIEGWYTAQTDGDWEHQFGLRIDTLDNPGWSVAIDVTETDLADRRFDRLEVHRSEDDWLVVWVGDSKWQMAC